MFKTKLDLAAKRNYKQAKNDWPSNTQWLLERIKHDRNKPLGKTSGRRGGKQGGYIKLIKARQSCMPRIFILSQKV